MVKRFGINLFVVFTLFLGSSIAQLGVWQDLPLQCYICSEAECDSTPNKTAICGERLDLCQTVFKDGNIVYRGCSSAMAKDTVGYCKENPNECFSCKSNRCNIATDKTKYIDCISCDSNSNPLCITNPKAITTTIKCHKSCMSALYPSTFEFEPNYEMIRGCLDDKEESDRQICEVADEKCTSCTENKCNTDDLPKDRLKCYKCDATNCNSAKPSPCLSYNKRDQCTFLLNSKKQFSSAQCKSNFPSARIPDLMLKNELIVCNEDGCNKIDNMPKPQNCLKCNSIENPFCSTDPAQIKTTVYCSNQPNTHCYTQVRGGITFRGCVNDLDIIDRIQCNLHKTDFCQTCLGETCNDQIFPKNRRRCFRCSSNDNKDCEGMPKGASVCPKYMEGDNCVVQYINNKITQRDCLSELPCDAKDSKKCRICADHNCNIANLKKENSAAGIYIAVGSLMAMAIHLL